MSLWLQRLGAELTGYALLPPTVPSLFEEGRVGEGMHSIIGDIRDLTALQDALKVAQPEIVIHMAAQPLVRYSYSNPVETYQTNVMGTVHLLEAVRHVPGVKAVVNITTDKCYENREWVWGYRENEPMGGYDPYSNSKGCAELVSAAYRSSFFNANEYSKHGVAVATVRAGNVIGGGDWAQDRLIPDIVAAFQNGKTVNIRNPHAIRPWQHVLEPLRGYLTLAQHLYEEGPAYAEGCRLERAAPPRISQSVQAEAPNAPPILALQFCWIDRNQSYSAKAVGHFTRSASRRGYRNSSPICEAECDCCEICWRG